MGIHMICKLRTIRIAHFSLILFGLAWIASIGCRRQPPPTKLKQRSAAPATKVQVGVVRTQLLERKVSLPATIMSNETAMLMPRVEAYVEKVLVDIGDEVPEGAITREIERPRARESGSGETCKSRADSSRRASLAR